MKQATDNISAGKASLSVVHDAVSASRVSLQAVHDLFSIHTKKITTHLARVPDAIERTLKEMGDDLISAIKKMGGGDGGRNI